jgi:hemerythrin-like metal-binding protein
MPLLYWKDEYETGIQTVDHEHRALIDVINLLGEKLDNRRGRVEIYETLGEIRTLIAAHFAMEEHIMRDLHFGEYAEHKADHDRLLQEIDQIVRDVEAGGEVDQRLNLGERVGRWFGRHFESFDARLHVVADSALPPPRRQAAPASRSA